jgi:hypothetical protein
LNHNLLVDFQFEFIDSVRARFDNHFEALLYNSSPIIPKLHLNFNNFPAGSACYIPDYVNFEQKNRRFQAGGAWDSPSRTISHFHHSSIVGDSGASTGTDGRPVDTAETAENLNRLSERKLGSEKDKMSPRDIRNGEAGIRTRGKGLNPYDGLANRCLKPLGHLSEQSANNLHTAETHCKKIRSKLALFHKNPACRIPSE